MRRRLSRLAAQLDALEPARKTSSGEGLAAERYPAPAPTDPSADLRGCCLDRETYQRHRLTPAERTQFAEQGWLLVDNALLPAEVEELTAVLDREHALKLQEPTDPSHPDAMNRMAVFSPANSLGNAPAVHALMANPVVFPKIVDILGWNIGVYHAHANLSPPPSKGDVLRDGQFRPAPADGAVHGFHQVRRRPSGLPCPLPPHFVRPLETVILLTPPLHPY